MAGARAGAAVPDWREAVVADYVAAEDALRGFTERNFGRMCAICARWTLLAARSNDASLHSESRVDSGPGTPAGRRAVRWRLSSWVTNCCNANHALESMSETSLAGIVASREEGRAWWRKVKRAAAAPCAALTDSGCHLRRGRPELCNRYFCEAVRDYLWLIGGEQAGAHLAARLDELQRRWAKLYLAYQSAVLGGAPLPDGAPSTAPAAAQPAPGRPFKPLARWWRRQDVRSRLRDDAGWAAFFTFLAAFDREIARAVRPLTPAELAQRLFKVQGDPALYEPFFTRELAAIDGHVRAAEPQDGAIAPQQRTPAPAARAAGSTEAGAPLVTTETTAGAVTVVDDGTA
ncbi:MAG TPA: hypothetical protein VHS99_00555 [Chloroflexota bacterium]|nr:hypothetical protein [Chloroflexota bacterium]